MNAVVSPSIMCADLMNLRPHLRALEELGCGLIHVDVMDGHFVPNFTLGTDFVSQLHEATTIPLDVHLMVEKPELCLPYFRFRPGDVVSVHAEATAHLQRVLAQLRAQGLKAAVAINPATPLSCLDYVLDDLDMVVVMTVNPGFAGQKLVPATLGKITRLRSLLDQHGLANVPIEVDGNVSFVNARKMRDAGADVFVAGTSSLYGPGDLRDNYRKLLESVR